MRCLQERNQERRSRNRRDDGLAPILVLRPVWEAGPGVSEEAQTSARTRRGPVTPITKNSASFSTSATQTAEHIPARRPAVISLCQAFRSATICDTFIAGGDPNGSTRTCKRTP